MRMSPEDELMQPKDAECFSCGERTNSGAWWQGPTNVVVCHRTDCWEKLLHLALDAAFEFSIRPVAKNVIEGTSAPEHLHRDLDRIRNFSKLWLEKCEKVFWYKQAVRLEALLKESISKAVEDEV